jgi:hypothetical protein
VIDNKGDALLLQELEVNRFIASQPL